MADYKETSLKAKQRSNFISITNELWEIPSIEFVEEIVTIENDTSLISKVPRGSVKTTLEDPGIEFDLLNPADDSIIGSSTYGMVQVHVYSLYRNLANKRDAEQ